MDRASQVANDAKSERLQEAIAAYLQALDAGRTPEPQEWLACYPDLAGELRAFFADQERLQQLAAPLRADEPGPAPESPAELGEPADLGDLSITLKVTEGPHQGRTFTFVEHDMFIVGRSKRAHFRLPFRDKQISRVHFLVEVNPPHCRLMDMGSRNGTYVNGRRVKGIDLQEGDHIKAGQTRLSVWIAGAPTPVVGPENTPTQRTPAEERVAAAAATAPSARTDPKLEKLAAAPPEELAPSTQWCRLCTAVILSSSPESLPVCPACQEQMRAHPQPIPGYQIARELGRGAMGVVHLALRVADGSVVALKTIIPAKTGTRAEIERFLREARILQDLDHPNIVAFHDMGAVKGRLYFAMEYVRGIDTAQLVHKHGPLPIARGVGLISQLLQALEYAHAKGFVHRDIKPANLLVSGRVVSGRVVQGTPSPPGGERGRGEGGKEVVKLADFGLARVYQASHFSGLTLMGAMGGTVAFMPPEQITNFRDVNPQADQYSAAATLYALLTNHYLFNFPRANDPRQAETQILMILHRDPVPIQLRRKDIPRPLAEVIHRALAKEPKDRFPDVKTMRRELLRCCK